MMQRIFVNVPVADLARSKTFYQALGFHLDPRFTDDSGCCVVISDTIFLMALTHTRFGSFAPLPRADTKVSTAVVIGITRDSRQAVDAIAAAAVSAGGALPTPALDLGFMYRRIFLDPDGNVFEPMWLDVAATAAAVAT